VSLSASGLPSGVTASFGANPATGDSSVLTLTASSAATVGGAAVTVNGTGGGLTRTTPINLTVNQPVTPDYALSASPPSLTVTRGSSMVSTISVTRSGGFTGDVTLSASGLPAGVTASFGTNPATGDSSVLTLAASGTATLGAASVTVSGTGGGLTRMTSVVLTVIDAQTPDFGLSASPANLTVNRGASGMSTIAVARTGGFTGEVTLSASGLPAGVTASLSTNPVTGASSVLTLSVSGAAPLGAATITVSGNGGGLTRMTTVILTVSEGVGGNGGVTVTAAINANSPWYNEEAIRLDNTGALTALSITIIVQRTAGLGFNGMYNTVGGQVLQTDTVASDIITYQYTIAPGQTLDPGANRTFAAQMSGTGTAHPTAGDTWVVSYTTGGVTYTQTGAF
ncbi:MAG: hypothetical protein J2P21_01675, partial [Chloracidobacterium sp.]|nr:hypothetical protein [Chloracidobacterium sp.]